MTLALLISLLLAAQPDTPQDVTPCVLVHHVNHSYDGPLDIDDTCLTVFQFRGDHMEIETIDFGDRVFHGDFELWPANPHVAP